MPTLLEAGYSSIFISNKPNTKGDFDTSTKILKKLRIRDLLDKLLHDSISGMVYFSHNLPSKSPILIIMYYLELSPGIL